MVFKLVPVPSTPCGVQFVSSPWWQGHLSSRHGTMCVHCRVEGILGSSCFPAVDQGQWRMLSQFPSLRFSVYFLWGWSVHTTWDTEGLLNDRRSCSSHQEHRRKPGFICWSSYQARIALHHLSLKHLSLTGNCVCFSCMHKAQTLITKTGSHMLEILSGSCFLQAGKHSRNYLKIVPF